MFKKLLIAFAFIVSSTAVMAQEMGTAGEKFKVSTNTFWSNWYVQGGVQMAAFYPSTDRGNGWSGSPFKGFRSNPQMSLAIGKWFTPGLGLRTKFSGIWGKAYGLGINTQHSAGHHSVDDCDGESFKYWNMQEQVLFNISNMICGYNPERVWNFIPFIGVGYARNCSANEYATATSLGLLNQFRINDKISVNLELGWNRMENSFYSQGRSAHKYGWNSHDNGVYAEVGVTFNISKSKWDKAPDLNAIEALSQSQIDALEAQLSDAEAENERLRGLLEEKEGASGE